MAKGLRTASFCQSLYQEEQAANDRIQQFAILQAMRTPSTGDGKWALLLCTTCNVTQCNVNRGVG